ncbi:MAG: hypothetical protein CME71_07920 [Halobacteriovorax sp.]|nr:hypothetical protein [Halobacteriovorax sp.]
MSLWSSFKSFFSHAPSYSTFLELGYKARTYNGDFIFSRSYDYCFVNIHQGVEPHNKKFGHLIDFEIEDACIIISFKEDTMLKRKQIDQIRELFDFVYEREIFLFCMNKNMDFNDESVSKIARDLHSLLMSS